MGRFGHSDRWTLDYAPPTRHYAVVRSHRPWMGDLVFVLSFFACVLSVLFVVTLLAHFVIEAFLY
jgi:hypothetical protein